jgi:hypothetical protein
MVIISICWAPRPLALRSHIGVGCCLTGYGSIIGGLVHESLKDMTGGSSDEITLNVRSDLAVGLALPLTWLLGFAGQGRLRRHAVEPSLDVHQRRSSCVCSVVSRVLWSWLICGTGYMMGCGNPKATARQFQTNNGIVQVLAAAVRLGRAALSSD